MTLLLVCLAVACGAAATVMCFLLAGLRTSGPRAQLLPPAASDDSAGDRPPVMGGLLPIAEIDELQMWRANLRALIDEMNLEEVRRLQDYAWSIRGK